MDEAKSNPAGGHPLPIKHGDLRWPASEGWQKYSHNNARVEIHYQYNRNTGVADDFKFKSDPHGGSPHLPDPTVPRVTIEG